MSSTAMTCALKVMLMRRAYYAEESRRLGDVFARLLGTSQAMHMGKCDGERMLQRCGARRRGPPEYRAGFFFEEEHGLPEADHRTS